MEGSFCSFPFIKLGQLGLPNPIVNNLNSKPSEFDLRIQYESDSNDDLRVADRDFHIILMYVFLIKADHFQCNFYLLIKIRLKMINLKDRKSQLKTWKSQN